MNLGQVVTGSLNSDFLWEWLLANLTFEFLPFICVGAILLFRLTPAVNPMFEAVEMHIFATSLTFAGGNERISLDLSFK